MTLSLKIFLSAVCLLVIIQFIRPEKNSGPLNPENDISSVVHVPANVKLILDKACYDCHSNSTKYPWYAEIMPFGWWLNHHVKEGKEHLNFSEFKKYSLEKQDHKLEETKEEVSEKEMPLKSYTISHREAALSPAEIKLISDWVDAGRSEINSVR